MLQNIRWRTVSPVIGMIVRLLQYGQERFKPKRKGKRENRGNRNIMLTIGSHGRRFLPRGGDCVPRVHFQIHPQAGTKTGPNKLVPPQN